MRTHLDYVVPPGASQARDEFILFDHLDPEEVRDRLVHLRRVHGAFRGGNVSLDHGLRERTAARMTTGAAVGVRQHVFDIVDSRIFIHVKPPVGHSQYAGRCSGWGKTS